MPITSAATLPDTGRGPSRSLLDECVAIVGAEHVLLGEDVSSRATHFWNPAPLQAAALLRPASTEQVSQLLAACHRAGQAVVTHGGVTGLVEGDRSTRHDVILSLERMRAIESVDAIGRTMSVQAGCVLQSVQDAAREVDLEFGLDLGARGSCTIGGNIATNAGGLSVLRYGMMREQVLGLEVVLADGTVMTSMNRMLKNNAGYDLKHWFIGSEGTLGIVTRAVLRLRAPTRSRQTAVVAFEDYPSVTALLAHLDTTLNGTLNAFEVLWQPFYRLNTDPAHESSVDAPLGRDHPIYAIVESRGSQADSSAAGNDQERFQMALETALDRSMIVDAAIAQSAREQAQIWRIRENIEIALEHDPMFVYDVSLPIAAMNDFVGDIEARLRREWPDLHFYAYGHLADGNLHLMASPLPIAASAEAVRAPQDGERDDATGRSGAPDDGMSTPSGDAHQRCDELVYTAIGELGGSLSAEHGIGLTKRAWLHTTRNAIEIELMRTLKQTLDPTGILNPGKIL